MNYKEVEEKLGKIGWAGTVESPYYCLKGKPYFYKLKPLLEVLEKYVDRGPNAFEYVVEAGWTSVEFWNFLIVLQNYFGIGRNISWSSEKQCVIDIICLPDIKKVLSLYE